MDKIDNKKDKKPAGAGRLQKKVHNQSDGRRRGDHGYRLRGKQGERR